MKRSIPLVKKTIVPNKTKPTSPRKGTLKVGIKKAAATVMPRLALNHNQIVL
ncbi:MAG TPA: hypothetical protein VIW23_02080 [Candidatus Acidoferrum sp.]|jgi:hypothetical protein